MIPKWHFNLRRPCERMRDSANEAFFTAESLENLSEALVREAIQNSLDASQRDEAGSRQVRIRIAFQGDPSPEAKKFLADQYSPVGENFSKGLGVSNITSILNNSGYIVIEDFGTRGLTGDALEYRSEKSENNAFFSFFRAEGRSGKSGESLGRWGIGKQVFPTASNLNSMFGLTIREDSPCKVLMGSAVVKNHSINGDDFQPDAWFGCREDADQPVHPVEEDQFIKEFSQAFGLKRQNECGLSVVVPFLDDRVEYKDIIRGVIRSFFWPIFLGELFVEIESPEGDKMIDAETLLSFRALLPASEAAVIELAAWAAFSKPDERVTLSEEVAIRPIWTAVGNQLLSEEKLNEVRTHLENNQRVAVRIPVRVRPKYDDGIENMSFLTVYIGVCHESGSRPIFLRDGIVITDVRAQVMSGTRSLVVIEDAPLAGLLGDSEGVNHTQWQKDSPKFHNRYVYGPDTIKFVTRSVTEIMQRLHAGETKGDPSLLLNVFFVPADQGIIEKKRKPKKGEPEVTPGPPQPPPPPRPKPFSLDPVKGGFLIRPGTSPFKSLPAHIRVEAAYDIRRGNPIKKWTKDDFSFNRAPIRIEPKPVGVAIIKNDGNTLELEVRDPKFSFGVLGFDTKRDLFLRAIQMGGGNEEEV